MQLDVPTLMLANAFVCVLCSSFLALAWWQSRERAAIWWSAAFAVYGAAVLTLALGYVLHPALLLPGLMLLVLPPAMVWSGIRIFFRVPALPLSAAAGIAVWPTILVLPQSDIPGWAPATAHALLVVAFNAAIVWELLRHRSEHLRARMPLVALTLVNIAVYAMAIPDAITGELPKGAPPPLDSMFGLIHFETLIYAIGTTVFLVALIKERAEQRILVEARTDALTGIANRRSFLEMSARVASRCRRNGQPLAIAVFDLDWFKSINDSCGHAVGDDVLRLFAKVARDTLRPGDLISRVGGEEFFAVLPGAELDEARATADRVREAFEQASGAVARLTVPATVSAGVMASPDASAPLATLIEQADAALYRAKIAGRNRVKTGTGEAGENGYPRLVHVA